MSDFLLLGHQQVGSFALSSDKTHLFSMALGAYLDIICEVFNSQGIPASGWHERRTLPWNYGVPEANAWRR